MQEDDGIFIGQCIQHSLSASDYCSHFHSITIQIALSPSHLGASPKGQFLFSMEHFSFSRVNSHSLSRAKQAPLNLWSVMTSSRQSICNQNSSLHEWYPDSVCDKQSTSCMLALPSAPFPGMMALQQM